MGYYILDRPAGTLPFRQGAGSQLSSVAQTGAQGIQDMIYRKAAGEAGLQPSYERDAAGNWKIGYKPKSEDAGDFKTKMMLALAGFTPMETILGEENVQQQSPFKVGEAAGGQVLTPFGSTKKDGYIYDAAGKQVGEYDPSYVPEKVAEPYTETVRQALRTQVLDDPIARKAVGIPKAEETPEQAFEKSYQRTIGRETGKAKAAADIQPSRSEVQKMVQALQVKKATTEDIKGYIVASGYDPEQEPFRSMLSSWWQFWTK